jgi:methionyl-tRNA synthetase
MDIEKFFPTLQPFSGLGGALLGIVIIWSLVWKGLALWRAARQNDSLWYIFLLVINTAGILEIIYYFLIAKDDKK